MNLTIIKKIAKQGKNRVLIIPKNLHHFLEGGDLVKVEIQKLTVEDTKKSKMHKIKDFGTPEISRKFLSVSGASRIEENKND